MVAAFRGDGYTRFAKVSKETKEGGRRNVKIEG
jgi:hypothetical protein